MIRRNVALILAIAFGLVLVACGSASDSVPSLGATPTAVVGEETLGDEAKVMAFVQCMRDEGIEFKDPLVDSDGNVQFPELVEGLTVTREELAEPYAACAHHLEGLSFGRQRGDVTERVDQLVALATCLRDKGYDVDDPTAETLDQWGADFRVEFDWDDPAAKEAYQECSSPD
ncbi:hypothetical protein ACFLTC_03380 [Chloroflexota bacterium]